MNIPKEGDVYTHYKGNKYVVIGVSAYWINAILADCSYIARHTETKEIIIVSKISGGILCYSSNGVSIMESLVIYKLVEENYPHPIPTYWARPLDMFMEVLEDGRPRFLLEDCDWIVPSILQPVDMFIGVVENDRPRFLGKQ